jgi:DNA-binding NarL/FixJ family response regulator
MNPLIRSVQQSPAGISLREREVLTAISEGLTNAGIARKLSISPKTVESHRASLMRKLDVNSTASLLVQAVRSGLLEI